MSSDRHPMPRRARLGLIFGAIGASAVLAASLPSLGGAGDAVVAAAAKTATINIDNFAFAPPDLSVAAGTTVTWKNEDDSPHRVAEANNAFSSAALDTDDSFSHTFAKPGVYKYFCSIHPYMVGKIVVKATRPSS
ncbi:MAG TPA: cupredoxin family copper-binding protein [Stellaceae bacterium]|nr:cupredoxin family copper-binding protein [Stellaceae bacterium]